MARILYLWQAGYPWEVRVEKFCQALRAAGHEVTVLARCKPGQPPLDQPEPGLRIVRVGHGLPGAASLPVPVNPVWSAAIRREVAAWKPDLVLAREIMLTEPAAAVCRRRGIPVVMDMAEHYPATMRALDKYRRGPMKLLVVQARLPDRVERRAVARADGIITVCQEQNDRLQAVFGYRPDRMAVVHNTPDLAFLDGVRRGAATPPRVFAYHGFMTAQRGLDRLIQGFAAVAARHPEIRLELAGDGESRPTLRDQVRACGLAERIDFPGRFRFDELPALYGRADVGLLTYPVDESIDHTLGNKLFDYLACGKPVLVSPAVPLRRVVETTGAGLVLRGDTPDAIAEGLEALLGRDPAPFAAAGLAAAAAVYNWDHDQRTLLDFLGRFH